MPRPRQGVERGGRMSVRGSPALDGSLPYPHHLTEGKRVGDEAGRMEDRRCASLWILVAGEVVARCGDDIAQKRTRWPPVPLHER